MYLRQAQQSLSLGTTVLFLAFAAAIFVPKIVDSKMVRDRLRSNVKEATGFDVDFKHLKSKVVAQLVADLVRMSEKINNFVTRQ